ncbi:MAG: MFS transporter [Bacteroidia bacterium]|nr:MFS transporter [Bacteroidia bacterium]
MAFANTSKALPIFPVLLVNFIGMLGYSIVIPLLVFLVQRFGGNEVVYGLLGAIYPAFQLVGAPILGRWSDDIGRKRVLMLSQAGTFLAWLLFIWALVMPVEQIREINSSILGTFFVSIPLLLLVGARALDGLTGGNVSVANAYLSDISTDKTRKANFGKMASSTSLGFIIGPMLASLLGGTSLGEMLPVMVAAGISMVAILVIYFYLPESHEPKEVHPEAKPLKLAKLFQIEHKECYEHSHKDDSKSLRQILKVNGIPLMFTIYFFTFLGFSFFYSGFPVFAVNTLEWETSELGIFFTISSSVMVIAQGPLLTYLSDKVGESLLITVGSLLIGISFILIPFSGAFWVYGCVVLLALGNGIMWPSFMAILGKMGDPNSRGTIMGYGNSMGSAASICGLVMGGLLFNYLGSQVFFLAGFIMILIFIFAFRLKRYE